LDHKIHCENITVLDANKDLDFPEEVRSLKGEDYLKDIDKYDIIFKSSGVPIVEELFPYKEKIITQVQLFFDTYPGKVIAITASKGKSTISSLIYTLLINAGYRAKLVGNIGTPIFDEINIQEGNY
jgi:UDP-N-acetylmuramoylalanine--D-glutamate ligase